MKRDDVTPRPAYWPVILRVLVDLGGKGRSAEVLQQVEMRIRQTLTPEDYEPRSLTQPEPRWHYEANWSRTEMRDKDKGLLVRDSPHGWWEITDKGRVYLAEHEQDAHPTGLDHTESPEHVRATNIAHVSLPEEITDLTPLVEGAKEPIVVNRYERNREARRQCIDHYGTQCVVCDFDFATVYGPEGAGFIHVHHLRALADVGAAYTVDPIKDLRPVCPNCHAFIHLRNPPYEIEEVRELRSKQMKAPSGAR